MGDQSIEQVYHYCPRCGARHPAPGAVPFRCRVCNFAQFFGPVAAVGGLLVDDDDALLLVRRARDPGKGRWGLPGGFVDRAETIEQALEREIREETALEITSMRLLVTYPNRYVYAGVAAPVIDLFYVCEIASKGSMQLADGELDHAEWTRPTPTHLAAMAFPSNRRAIEFWLASNGRT